MKYWDMSENADGWKFDLKREFLGTVDIQTPSKHFYVFLYRSDGRMFMPQGQGNAPATITIPVEALIELAQNLPLTTSNPEAW